MSVVHLIVFLPFLISWIAKAVFLLFLLIVSLQILVAKTHLWQRLTGTGEPTWLGSVASNKARWLITAPGASKRGGPSQLIWEPELLPYSTSAQAWCEDMKRPDDWERTFQWSRRHFVCNSQMSVMKHWNLILENYQHNTGHCETRCKHAVYIYLIYQTERNADMTVCMCIFLFQFHQVLWERKKNG